MSNVQCVICNSFIFHFNNCSFPPAKQSSITYYSLLCILNLLHGIVDKAQDLADGHQPEAAVF